VDAAEVRGDVCSGRWHGLTNLEECPGGFATKEEIGQCKNLE
jgi:hypothetical protein